MDIKSTRNNLVAKDNRMIQNGRFALGAIENKAILYLISKIQPDDTPDKLYKFNCKEFQALIKWNDGASYKKIKLMLTKLSDMRWWIDLDDNNEALVRWFNIIHANKGTGDIEISFHEDMFPFLLNLQQHLEEDGHYYTTYRLQNITLMKHRYSPRIYELLKSYQYNNQRWTFENGTGSKYDIQRRIADKVIENKENPELSEPIVPEGWTNWAVFQRDVLKPAVQEINKYSDIKVAYVGKKEDLCHRKTRAVRTIEFYMVGKTSPEQRATDELIDAEYIAAENNANYHQMSIEEMFFQNHEKKLEEERTEKREFDRVKRQEITDKSKYPLIAEYLDEKFSESQICALYDAAIMGRVAGVVAFSNWELFAVDYITYYYELVKATPEDTKSTEFKRLLNLLRKDYDGYSEKLVNSYIGKSNTKVYNNDIQMYIQK